MGVSSSSRGTLYFPNLSRCMPFSCTFNFMLLMKFLLCRSKKEYIYFYNFYVLYIIHKLIKKNPNPNVHSCASFLHIYEIKTN